MGLDRYGSVRVRFTWRNRAVNRSAPQTSQKVLADSKDQRGHGGKCMYFATCTALESHQRLRTDQPCPELSWRDLEKNSRPLKRKLGVGGIGSCLAFLKQTGLRYERDVEAGNLNVEDTLKIKDFERINTKSAHAVDVAVREYLKEGPMLGTFEVFGGDFDLYGQSNFVDEIYVANAKPSFVTYWTHSVVITGFGVQGPYPFWEFQNSYGPLWRGAARGFGQIYAVHLKWLYGFRLA